LGRSTIAEYFARSLGNAIAHTTFGGCKAHGMRMLPEWKRREGLYQTPSLVVNEGSWSKRRITVDHSIRKRYDDFSEALCASL
jgi:hypothetical protein